jgi:transcriptional regulator with XRE-family HTH domain
MISDVRYVVSMTRKREPTEWEKMMSERLKALRQVLGLTQEEAARAVGVSLRGYQGWEQSQRSFNFEMGVRIADALGVSLNVLAGKEPLPKPKGGK